MKKINDESEKINQPSAASDTVDTEDGIYFNINHEAKTPASSRPSAAATTTESSTSTI